MRRLLVIGCLLLFAAGCSEPPQKEIDQAQSALDAARSAGADKYATAEFTAAASSLDKARAAVDQRDYRQALNYAIDARQRSTDAARQAAGGKAQARREAESAYGETVTRANRLQSMLHGAASGGVPARALRPAEGVLRNARSDLQEASASISAGNYEDATKVLLGVRGKLDAAITQVQNIPPRPPRKRGRSRQAIQRPSKITSAHPVRNKPSGSHSTRWVPPGDDTCTSRWAPP